MANLEQKTIRLMGRKLIKEYYNNATPYLPDSSSGLECILLINDEYGATFRFRDAPRQDSHSFIRHLAPKHNINRIMLVSGDRKDEVCYLAEQVGISGVLFEKSPEEKVGIVRAAAEEASTLFLGDGINDAPAMQAATVGIAFGLNSDVTAEAADAVVTEASLSKVNELIHIGQRMRIIALQSAIAGMALSTVGMFIVAIGHLPPIAGAITQEVIDVLAVLNALRVAIPDRNYVDDYI